MQKHLLTVILVLWSFTGFSQSFQQNKNIKGLNLPSNFILSLCQDDVGRIWVSTAKGVFYSDGITTYALPDSIHQTLQRRPHTYIDADGIVYAYNTENIKRIFYSSENSWSSLPLPEDIIAKTEVISKVSVAVEYVENRKKLFIIVPGYIGVYDFEKDTWDLKSYDVNILGDYTSHYQEGSVTSFYFEKIILNLQDGQFSSEENWSDLLEGPVYKVVKGGLEREFYFLGYGKLAKGQKRKQPDEIIHQNFAQAKYGNHHYFDLKINDDKVFYYFNSHLYRHSAMDKLPLLISAEENLRIYLIQALLIDREDIIWIGSQRGLVNVPTLRFQNYTAKDGLLDNEVSALYRHTPNRFFLGFNNGVQVWENNKISVLDTFDHLKGTSGNRVNNFTSTSKGIYFSAGQKGLGLIDEKTFRITYQKPPDGNAVQYVALIDEHLYVLAGPKMFKSHISEKDIYAHDVTSTVFPELVEGIYLRKIAKLNDGKVIYLQSGNNTGIREGLVDDQHYLRASGYDFLETDEGILLATEEGLKIYSNGSVNVHYVNNKTVDRPIYSLLEDEKGAIWMGTDKGVYVLNKGNISWFDASRGLIGDEVNRGAFIRGNPGRIWIGTEEGISIYRQDEDEMLASPIVKIENIRLLTEGEQNFSLSNIPYNHNNIQFEYLAVSFMQQNNLHIHYRLRGYSDHWETIVDPRTKNLIFDNLPPGTYFLELKASLGGQFESDIIVSDTFTIDQPYYLKPIFIFFVLVLFLALGFILNTLLNQFRNEMLLRKTISQKISEIQLAEEQFRNVWNSSKDGLCLSVLEGKIIAVNPAMIRLCGVPAKELKNNNIGSMFADQTFYQMQRPHIVEALKSNGKAGFTQEMTMPFKNEYRTIELFCTLVDIKHGEDTVILSVFRDITEKKNSEIQLRKAKEKAEESNQLKSRFLSNMSHEIRTPLNGILGSAENLIITNQDRPELLSGLEIILESGERLLKTINSILDMSKIESRTMETRLEETNINDFISKILMPLKAAAMKKGLLLTAKFETKSFIAPIDKASLDMILNNIVSNAIKYSHKGLIQVKIRQLDHSLYIQVQDEGIGMSEEFLMKIFQPFQQESGGYTRKFEGSGLGLSITKSLTDMLKGQIYITSSKGKGTTVTITLPLEFHPIIEK